MTTKYGVPVSQHIAYRSAVSVLHAVRYATESGAPITHLITIDFAGLGFDDGEAGRMFLSIRQRVSRWWADQWKRKKRPLGAFAATFAHANPSGHRHVHWLVRLPDEVVDDFHAVLLSRIRKVTGVADLGDAVDMRRASAPGTLAKYTLKGVEPQYADHLYITPADEGFVSGRRVGVTRAIGRTARREAGWVRRRKPKRNQKAFTSE